MEGAAHSKTTWDGLVLIQTRLHAFGGVRLGRLVLADEPLFFVLGAGIEPATLPSSGECSTN